MNSRISYYLGHFEGPFLVSSPSLKDSLFAWKCSIKARTPTAPPPALPLPLKQSMALWSKGALGGAIDGAAWFQILESFATDPAMSEEASEGVYLMAVESFLGAERFEEAFSVLKRMKASNIDG